MKRTSLLIKSADLVSNRVTLTRPLNNVKEIRILNIEVPVSYYSVNSTNNVLKFTGSMSSPIYTVTIPAGNYEASELAQVIEDLMNATAFTGFAITYDQNTLKYTITNATTFILRTANTTCNVLIGFNTEVAAATSWTSDKCINISGYNHVFLQSVALQQGRERYLVGASSKDFLVRIPIDQMYGSIVRYTSDQDYNRILYQDNFHVHAIDMTLVGEDYTEVNLNGLSYYVEIEVLSKQD